MNEEYRSKRISYIVMTATLVLVLNITTPTSLPPPLGFFPLRLAAVISGIFAIIDPLSSVIGTIIGHFVYNFYFAGVFQALAALIAPWTYFIYGHIVKFRGKITIGRLVIGHICNIIYLTTTLSLTYSLILSVPILFMLFTFLIPLVIAETTSFFIIILILPHIRKYILAELKLKRFW